MTRLRLLLPALALALAACGGNNNNNAVVSAYDACIPGDVCNAQGFNCQQSALPGVSFTGDFCTINCSRDSDCPVEIGNLTTVCEGASTNNGIGQCFIPCINGDPSNCPPGQGCFLFNSDLGGGVELCTP
jgi:hypothetical protein